MRFFLLILSIAMLWGGSQALYTVATNLKPTELSIEAFEKSPSSKKWLRVKGGHIDLTESVTASSFGSGEAKEAYLPIRREGAESGDPVSIVLATKNAALLKVINEMTQIEDEEQMVLYGLKNHEALFQQKDAQGLVRFGIELDDSDERQLRELIPELTKDFVVLDEGKSPEWPMIMMLFMGIAAAYGFIKMGGKKTPSGPTEPASMGPPPVPQ